MLGDLTCPRCGQLIPIGQTECPHCTRPKKWWIVERESLLIASVVALFVLFGITGVAANLYHSKQKSLGQEWFARGEVNLKAGRAEVALEDFRTALVYAPDTSLYRLRLAQALIASNRVDEARSHLLTIWRDEPGNATVNLELARLAVKQSNAPDAMRYYHNAIFGVWRGNPDVPRQETRWELCEFLLKQGETAQAQSELIALAADLPPDAALHTRVAGLFSQAGDFARALEEYQKALEIDRHQDAALAGAGETAFEMRDYSTAVTYLERVARTDNALDYDKDLLATARLVLNLDPMRTRLSRAEADRRALNAFEFAAARLAECLQARGLNPKPAQPQNELQRIALRADQLQPDATAKGLRQNPDLRVTLMDVVSDIELTTEKECGSPKGVDLALLLISEKRGAPEQ
jgi:tetratricopeptide (TPR) repeat protein